jgi:hypothetical protein
MHNGGPTVFRERDFLKTTLHRIYGKFLGLRAYIRSVKLLNQRTFLSCKVVLSMNPVHFGPQPGPGLERNKFYETSCKCKSEQYFSSKSFMKFLSYKDVLMTNLIIFGSKR